MKKDDSTGNTEPSHSKQALRKQAEARLAQSPDIPEALSPGEALRTLHELRVHQIELEMQNEELRRAQAELEAAHARYFDLYDLAPVGYVTVSEKGLILDANLTAATLLGVERKSLVKQPISRFIHMEDQDIYYRHRKQLFETGAPQACEFRMLRRDGAPFWARLDATAIKDADGTLVCRVAISDITSCRQAEENYRTLFMKMLDGFAIHEIICDAEGKPSDYRFLAVNLAFERMTGLKAADIVGRTVLEALPGTEPHWIETYGRVALTGEPAFFENYSAALKKYFQVTAFRPAPNRFACIFADITERKRMEEALRANEEKYRLVVDNASEVIIVVQDGMLRFVNPALVAMLGFSEQELKSRPFPSFVHPDDRAKVVERHQKRLRGETVPTRYSFRAITKDGNARWTEASAVGIEWEGRPATLGLLSDITDRKRAEDALWRKQTMLSRTESFAHIGSWEWNVATDSVTWSDELFRIFQRNPADGTPSFAEQSELYYPEDMQRLRAAVKAALSHGTPYELELRAIRKDGETRVCLARGYAETGHGKSVTRLFGSLQDITERKQAEEELKRKNEEMVRFAYTVSHDLKSPLVTIKTFLGYLVDDVKARNEKAQAEDVGYIRNAADKMENLLDELLELSRIGRKTSPPQEIPLQAVAQSAIDLVSGRLSKAGVKTSVTDLPVLLYGDVQRLEELYQNLVDNAVKFMGDQPEPRIEIGALREDAKIALFVRDNGVGIDPRCQKKLFGLFEKMDKNTEGVGMGLAIVKRIVEVHGGEIRAESEGLGKGTTFWFTLAGTRLKDKG